MKVKVCDLKSDEFNLDFIDSVLETGFAVLINHGISYELIKENQKQWKEFFLANQDAKNQWINKENSNMGYKGLKTETAVGSAKADLKEFYHWKPGQAIPKLILNDTQKLFSQLGNLSNKLLTTIDRYQDLNYGHTNYAKSCEESDNTILRTIYYPAMDFDIESGAVRSAAHEDINFITLLVAASAPGLQVLDKNGAWHDVPHEENSITLNIGDMLQLASGGRYKSTTHRVVNPENNIEDRLSMPFFVHPHSDVHLTPNKTAGQFLKERIAEIYGGNR